MTTSNPSSTSTASEEPAGAGRGDRAAAVDPARLLDDRIAEGVFAVHREAFTSEAVHALEVERIFERTWVYVGHESQVAKPNDYITTTVGRQPVLVTRDAKGQLHGLLNSCRHRGMVVCPLRAGNQKFHTCRYHGWVYDSAGANRQVSAQDVGRYPQAFNAQQLGLVPVARFDAYRGFLFASLHADVPPLDEHLGDSRPFLDLIADQATEQGLEFVPGAVTYTFDANWKMQIENALDMYHFAYVHVSYLDLVRSRAQSPAALPPPDGEQGSFSFGRGHALMWRSHSRVTSELLARRSATFAGRMSEAALKWSSFGRNLTIFPNMQIVDNVSSMMLRVIRPLSARKTEMQTWCIAPKGEPAAERAARIREYEDFFNPSGLATPDDNVIYEQCQTGMAAAAAGWTAGYLRGIDRRGLPDTSPHAQELGLSGSQWIAGPRTLGDESCFHDAYREWARLLRQAPAAVPAAEGLR